MWEALGGVAAVIGMLAGTIKWLLDKYFKKQEELEALRKNYTDVALENLRETVDQHKKELKIIKSSLDSSTVALQTADKDIRDLSKDVSSYVDQTNNRMQRLESEIIKIGNDLILIRGKNYGPKENK